MCIPEYLYAQILIDSLASEPVQHANSPVAHPTDRSSHGRRTSARPQEGPLVTLPGIGFVAPANA
jgi:hypothetical protein